MNSHAIFRAILAFLIFASPIVAIAESSQLSVSGFLYSNGNRPASGESIEILEIETWRDNLYVSGREIDGDCWLDIWAVEYGPTVKTTAVASYSFGNIQNNVLNCPRDLSIVAESNLALWSASKLHIYPLKSNGDLSNGQNYSFADNLNPSFNRIQPGGDFASSYRILLTGQEIVDLYSQGFTREQVDKLTFKYSLVNMQDPKRPFLVETNRSEIGLDYLTLEYPVTGTYNNLPAAVNISDDKKNAALTTFSVSQQSSRYADFWVSKLVSLFAEDKRNSTLGGIIDEVLTDTKVRSIQNGALRKFLRGLRAQFQVRSSKPLGKTIRDKYGANKELWEVLNELNINLDDSLVLAIQKGIEAQIKSDFDADISAALLKELGKEWASKIFPTNINPADLKTALNNSFNGELSSQGIESYLVKRIFAPLEGSPAYFKLTLNQLITSVSNFGVAGIIVNKFLEFLSKLPDAAVLDFFGWLLPPCYDIPSSAEDFLRLILIRTGPKLNGEGLAFFELLKLAQFHAGNFNLSGYVSDLTPIVQSFHLDLATEMVSKLSAFYQGIDLPSLPVHTIMENYSASFSLKSLVSRLLADAIIKRLTKAGATTDVSINEFFKAEGYYIDPSLPNLDLEIATTGKLIGILKKYKSKRVPLASLFVRAGGINLQVAKGALKLPLIALNTKIFGGLNLDISVEEGIKSYLFSRLSPHIFGDFTASLMHDLLYKHFTSVDIAGILAYITRINHGDCIAIIQRDCRVASIAAAELGLFPAAAGFSAAEEAITMSLNNAIDFVLDQLISGFVQSIFSIAVADYSSWSSYLAKSERNLDVEFLGGRSAQHVDSAIYRNKLALILRDMGASFPSNTGNDSVTVAIVDPLNQSGTLERVDLSKWLRVTSVLSNNGWLALVGERIAGSETEFAFQLTDYINSPKVQSYYWGPKAVDFSASKQLVAVEGGKHFVVLTEGKGIAFVARSPRA